MRPMDMTRTRALLAALAAVGCWAWSGAALPQLAPAPAGVGVPVAPPNPGAAMGAAKLMQDQLNARAGSGVFAPQQGGSPVKLGSGVEAAAPPMRGFMQPALAPLPGAPSVSQAGGGGVHSGPAPPGFFTILNGDDGKPAVKGLYTAPNARNPGDGIPPP